MKITATSVLGTIAVLLFVFAVVFKFLTIQSMDTDDKNFYLYTVTGDKLFSLTNDSNNTYVKVFDKERIKLGDAEQIVDNQYHVLPYSTITISDANESNTSMTYRFMAKSHKKSFSLPLRRYRYEIIGGEESNPNPKKGRPQHIARLFTDDSPFLAVFPEKKGVKTPWYDSDNLYVAALQQGLEYVDGNGKVYALPAFRKRDLGRISSRQLHKIEKDGYIRYKKNGKTYVLSVFLKEGTTTIYVNRSKRKMKYLTMNAYGDFSNISTLVFSNGSPNLYVSKERWTLDDIKAPAQKYLKVPYVIPLDKKITVKGRDTLFKFDKYSMNADFAKKVPRLDNPVKLKKNALQRRKNYMEVLDIDNMFGLYVSDEDAKIYFSSDKKDWIEIKRNNYKYAPPLYLNEPNIKGRFVAPESFKDSNKKIYYKIVATKTKYNIAFNGHLRVMIADRIIKDKSVFYPDKIPIHHKEVVLETQKDDVPECDRIHPKKTWLACKYKLPRKETLFPSLYAEDNFVKLLPSPRKRHKNKVVKKTDVKQTVEKSTNKLDIPLKLIPIYGDKNHFGLLSHGLTKEELTIDQNFSMRVGEIFEKEAKAAEKRYSAKLKKNNQMIEGATVVIKINKDKSREILAMFSYPYPKTYDTERERVIDVLKHKKSTIRNRAFDMLVPPGSTFKIVTSIALAQNGMLGNIAEIGKGNNLLDMKFGEKSKKKIDFSLGNSSNHPIIYTDYVRAFAASYNTYFAYAGLKLFKRLSKKYTKSLLPVLLNEEERKKEFGLIPVAEQFYFNKPIELSSKYKIKTASSIFPTKYISAQEVALAAIGQQEVRATALEMALVTSAIYDGKLIIPKIVKSEKPASEKQNETFSTIDELFGNETNLKEIQKAMKYVVEMYIDESSTGHKDQNTHGTAYSKFKDFREKYKKITIYGKTGTAETGISDFDDGWFVTFTKGLKEDLVIATVLRNSGYGSTYAAPINRKIIEAWIDKTEKKLLKSQKRKRKIP